MIKLDVLLLLISDIVLLIIPLIIGIVLLTRYGKDKLLQLVAWFTLKPLVAYPIWALIRLSISPIRIGLQPSPSNPLNDYRLDLKASGWALIPSVILTLAIIYIFRKSFKSISARVFLLGDILRWLYTFAVSILIFNFPTNPPYFGLVLVAIGFLIPSIYAIIALIFANSRYKSLMSIPGS